MVELALPPAFSTFRDPGGHVEIKSDGAFRSVEDSYASDILAFLNTDLSERLVADGHLVSSEILELNRGGQPLLLRHPRVSFASYCWEWSPALWFSAAELTLDLCAELVKDGWILKDATPLNVLFQGTKPIFVDVLSIQRLDSSQPLWFAYSQFIRTFLLPMVAHSQLGWPLHTALMRRDGFEPEEIYTPLTWSNRLRRPALTAVTLPMLFAKKGVVSAADAVPRTVHDPELTRHIIGKTLSSLKQAMRRAMPEQRSSKWSNYVEQAAHYSEDDHDEKRRFVTSVLAGSVPVRVLDVGCNTGVYSRLAADSGAEVVSIDTDMQAADRLCVALAGSERNILPLCVDLAHPTPAAGWENRENVSFLDRCYGQFDMVMMLAVIHHLLLNSQIPLNNIASMCSRITSRDLIVEWVPPTDPKFIEVMRGRGALYTHLTETAFREAFARYFDTAGEATLRNGRILFHLIKR